MIGNIQKGNYIKGVLEYHYKKIEEGVCELINTNIYSENCNDQIQFFLNTFSIHKNSRTKDYLFHASLNFSPEERLTHSKLNEIGEEYLQRMGYINVPYTIFVHNDKAHQHIHIVASRINFEGNISPVLAKKTMDIKINMEQCQILERKYKLVIATEVNAEERNKTKLEEINLQKYAVSNAIQKLLASKNHAILLQLKDISVPQLEKLKSDKQLPDDQIKKLLGQNYKALVSFLEEQNLIIYSKKQTLLNQINLAYQNAKSQEEFEKILSNKSVYCRILKDSKTKKPYYVFGIRSSSFYLTEKNIGSKFSYESISNLQTVKENAYTNFTLETQKRTLNKKIQNILKSSRTEIEFETNLRIQKIDYTYIKTNSNTKIQGIRFMDKTAENPIWLNGSEINRQFSWGNLEKQFNPIQSIVEENKKRKEIYIQTKSSSTKNKKK